MLAPGKYVMYPKNANALNAPMNAEFRNGSIYIYHVNVCVKYLSERPLIVCSVSW